MKVKAVQSTILEVPVGDPAVIYSTGDFLNAIDMVVSYFQNNREQTDKQLAEALRLYADYLSDDEHTKVE